MSFDPFTAGFDLGKTILDKFFPDANKELEAKINAAAQEIQNEYAIVLAQLAINQEEAKSPHFFVAGGRPFLIWVGGFGMAYELLFRPLVNGVLIAFGVPATFSGLDTGLLQTVLVSLLGISGMRSFDKIKGNDTKGFR